MALHAKVGSFNTGTGTSDIVITGLGFQPEALIVWWVGRTETTDAVGGASIYRGMGAGTGPSARGCIANFIEDGQPDTDDDRSHHTDAIICKLTDVQTVDGLADIKTFDTDGFTLAIDDAFSIDMRVHYLALGGTDFEAAFGSLTTPGSNTTQDTNVGFEPNGLIIFSTFSGTAGVPSANAQFAFGAADGSSEFYFRVGEIDGQGIANPTTMISNTHIYYQGSNDHATFDSFLPNGFRLAYTSTSSSQYMFYLAFRGFSFKVGDISTRTDGSNIVENGLGFQPVALMFTTPGGRNAYETGFSVSIDDKFSFGATDGSSRVTAAAMNRDGQTNSQTATALEHDAVYAAISTGDAIEGLMDLVSFDVDGFTVVMDDPDPSATLVPYIAFGLPTSIVLETTPASMSFRGQAAGFADHLGVSPAALRLTGQDAALRQVTNLVATPAQVNLSGKASASGLTFNVTTGAISFQGRALEARVSLTGEPGQVLIEGRDADIVPAFMTTGTVIHLTGQASTLSLLEPTVARSGLSIKIGGRPRTFWKGRPN